MWEINVEIHPNYHFLDIQQVNHESGMIVDRIVLPQTIYQNIVLSSHNMGFPFSDHRTFYRKFSRNFPENFQKFLGKFLHPHLPPLPIPHTTHPHPIPQTVNPLRTLNSLFSKTHFDCISTFISHTLQICTVSVIVILILWF